jgi:H+/Cl- antiporter ClcA
VKKIIERLINYGRRVLDQAGASSIKRNVLTAVPFWVASVITGLIAVAYTRLFALAEEGFAAIRNWQPASIFFVTPLFFVLAFLVVKRFSPLSKGSGIPQVMAAIDLNQKKHGAMIDRLLNLKVIIIKIFSSILMVLGGGAIGREGPTIQVAGSVFRVIDKLIPKTWPKLASQNFILTGAAAGLAAAFNTPLGGIVFAMEELAKIHIRFFRTALFTAVIIAGLTAQGFLGPYLYLGYPNVSTSGIGIFLSVAFVAVIAGWAASLMCRVIIKIGKWKKKFSPVNSMIFLVVAGLLMASYAYFLNDAIFGSGKVVMNHVLFSDDKLTGIGTVFSRMLGPIICFNTGASGGVFAPALAAGASLGAHISGLLTYSGGNANILILSGMVGFLTGITRTPFTSAILVLEMTDRHGVIFHLMLASMVANFAALTIDRHSFYEHLKKEYTKEHVPVKASTA